MQQRFGGDAANIQTGSAQATALFNNGGLQSQLGCPNGAIIAPWSPADDDDVKLFCHEKSS
jgi:hypothetical protein